MKSCGSWFTQPSARLAGWYLAERSSGKYELAGGIRAGHAMRCGGYEQCFGRVIEKALESLDEGTDVIQMLVMLR